MLLRSSDKVSYEVGEGLALNGATWSVLDVEFAQLHAPLNQSFRAFWLLQDLSQWKFNDYSDGIRLEVRS